MWKCLRANSFCAGLQNICCFPSGLRFLLETKICCWTVWSILLNFFLSVALRWRKKVECVLFVLSSIFVLFSPPCSAKLLRHLLCLWWPSILQSFGFPSSALKELFLYHPYTGIEIFLALCLLLYSNFYAFFSFLFPKKLSLLFVFISFDE